MSLDMMKVFNSYVQPALIETLGQMIEKFNANSRGAIRLTTAGFDGDFYQESFFAALHSAQRRVDRYASNGAATPTDLRQLQINGVKVAGGFGPIVFEPSQLTWLQKPTAEGIEVISRNMAEALLADQLNTAIGALVGAIGNQAALVNDVSATAPISQRVLNGAHAKFGDASGRIVANVMSGAALHTLIDNALANAEQLFVSGNVQIVDILGKAFVITDSAALSTGGKDRVLGLVDGAVSVWDGGDLITNIETTNGKNRIETTMQSDYAFGLSLKGYSWDVTNGGKSPTDAELFTGTNWDVVMTSLKDTAGVMAIGDTV
jgi:hypothetical protein